MPRSRAAIRIYGVSVSDKSLPPGPRGIVEGTIYSLLFSRDFDAGITRMYSNYGRVSRIKLGPFSTVILVGADANAFLMKSPPEKVQAGPAWRSLLPWYNGAPLTLDGDAHTEQLKVLRPSFTVSQVSTYIPTMLLATHQHARNWEGPVNLFQQMQSLTLDIAAQSLLGIRLEGRKREFLKRLAPMSDMILGIPVRNLPLSRRWRGMRAHKRMWALIRELITERIQCPGTNALGALLSASDAHDMNSLDSALVVNVFDMLAAGHKTTASLLTFALATLLTRRDLLERLRAELRDCLGNDQLTVKGMASLSFMSNFMKEVQRLYPPTPYIVRTAMTDLYFEGYYIPKDTTMLGAIRLTQLMPSLFHNPRQFNPDRYNAPHEEHKIPYALTPFGGGHHVCLGSNFAQIEAIVVLSALVRDFDFKLLTHKPLGTRYTPFGQPAAKILVKAVRRT